MKNAGSSATGRKAKARQLAQPKPDAEAMKIIEASGILNSDVTLDQIMELSAQLNTVVEARGAFIFRDFLYRPC